jgi:phosphopantetheinyl transferase
MAFPHGVVLQILDSRRSFLKATGEGIAQDLTSFTFTEEGAPALTRVSARWGLGALTLSL